MFPDDFNFLFFDKKLLTNNNLAVIILLRKEWYIMVKRNISIKISICLCLFVALALLVLLLFGNQIFEWYMTAYRGLSIGGTVLNSLKTVFAYCFYPSSVFASVILYSLLRLLFNIKNNMVFINKNAIYLKIISYCSTIIGLIAFACGFFYMSFMFVAMIGLFVGILLRVVKNVFQSAIELKDENDLTI